MNAAAPVPDPEKLRLRLDAGRVLLGQAVRLLESAGARVEVFVRFPEPKR